MQQLACFPGNPAVSAIYRPNARDKIEAYMRGRPAAEGCFILMRSNSNSTLCDHLTDRGFPPHHSTNDAVSP